MSESQAKQKKNSPVLKTVLTILLILTLLLAILMIILLFSSRINGTPEFEIKDNAGSWEAQGRIAVFDDTIMPGSRGEYDFIITNTSDLSLIYSFTISEVYSEDDIEWIPFMKYRVKMNGVTIITDDWFLAPKLLYSGIEILPKTSQLMTLEWWWDFDGNDANDTVIGRHGGSYTAELSLTAEVVEETIE